MCKFKLHYKIISRL